MTRDRSPLGTHRAARPLPANARDLAFEALDEYKKRAAFVRPVLDERAAAAAIAPEDRALAAEMAFGVVRRQATLNALVQPHVRRPRHSIEGPLWTLLQLGAYQLVLMESIPRHAAVAETVETCKRLGRRRWAGFLNATLRSVAGSVGDEFLNTPAADAVPLAPGRFRRLDRPVFADPEREPSAYFARAFSFPAWLVSRWAKRFEFAELTALGFWFNAPQPLSLRVNRLTATREALLAALAEARIDAAPGELPESVRLAGTTAVERLPGYAEGWFSVQDETAMQAAVLLAPQPGMDVLDLCAGRGTKTTHLAELMQDRGRVVATDLVRQAFQPDPDAGQALQPDSDAGQALQPDHGDAGELAPGAARAVHGQAGKPDVRGDRLALVRENARRLRISIIEPRPIRPDGTDIPAGPFDAALVDVPCTNTGVLGKRAEARWRIQPRDLEELPRLQRRLLGDACRRLKPGGRVVYSTCSIEPEENERVVQAVLRERRDLALSVEIRHPPGRPADGGYQALLVRT